MDRLSVAWGAATSLAAIALGTALFAQSATAQERQTTGSRTRPQMTASAREVQTVRAMMAKCMYRRNPRMVHRVLDNSDPAGISYGALQMTPVILMQRLQAEDCLSAELDLSSYGWMGMSSVALRYMLVEGAYTTRFATPPANLATPPAPIARSYVSTGAMLAVAQSGGAFADCVVRADPVRADALVRARLGSDGETAALRALVPTIQGCVTAGQSLSLSAATIRPMIADGLWQAYGVPAIAADPAAR